jgi:predicted NBD/HSP70 family sugar kinase
VVRIERLLAQCEGKKVEGIGVTVPGRLDRASGKLVFAPNLGWRDVDIRTPIERATGLEVELENAANACVMAAVWFDHVQSRNVVALTVAEGVGTGILVNGRVARGLSGMAGEFGHVPIDPKGPPCRCGGRGCWEVFASDRAALRYYLETSHESGLTFPDLLRLAEQGDNRAGDALDTMAHYLGRGMRMVVAGLDPAEILLIGDLTRAWNRFGPILQAEVEAQILPGGIAPRLIPVYGDGMARLRGTVALVLQKHFGSSPEVTA